MQIRRVRHIIIPVAVTIFILMCVHVGMFLMVRSRAINDYELVRQGRSLDRANMQFIAMDDGGTIGWETWGYRILRLKRFAGDFAESREDQEYLVGAHLEFTCRGRFPILQRWMKDREDSKIVVGP